jgi:HlyD family secretion protein
VAEVLVKEGDPVQAGQVILRLRSDQQAAGVAQAEAAVQRAQAKLDGLKAGPREQEVAAAQAAVDAAQAQVDKLSQGARPEEVAAAEAVLAAAQADQQKAQEGADPQELIAAQAEMANAQAAVSQAQAAYDRIKANADAGAYPQALALQEATNNLNAATARYQQLQEGATPATLAKAYAGVQQAQAELDRVKAAARPADLAAAQAEVRRAQAQLELLKAGVSPQDVQAAEAEVAAAQADLAKAEAALRDTELPAPFAGTLATLDVTVGEQVMAGTPIAQLADLSAWKVETTNLTEISVTRVREGAAASLAFDAVPGLQLGGKVTAIAALGENKQGDMVYTVTIVPDQADARLRWNMTAQVTFEP